MSATPSLGGISPKNLIATYGSPLYVYDEVILRQRCKELKKVFAGWKKTRLLYACKANSNPHLLKIIREEGYGLDCVSSGELALGFLTGFSAEEMMFTVNNMSDAEMHDAHKQVVLLNIDSLSRLERYGKAYPGSKVCLRLTPEVTAGHHVKVQTGYKESKFGILLEEVPKALALAKKYKLKIVGLHEHTGSGIADMQKTISGMQRLLQTAHQFPDLQFIDFGGGFPIPYYSQEKRFDLSSFGKKVVVMFADFCKQYGRTLTLTFEPGRYCVAEAGTLLCTVTCLKQRGTKTFVGVDTGFNHLVRPVMYDSYHHIVNMTSKGALQKYSVFGNICESGDCFGKDRMLASVREGDILAICDAGAYGFSMASTYNSRPLPAEVLVKKGKTYLIRQRQTVTDFI